VLLSYSKGIGYFGQATSRCWHGFESKLQGPSELIEPHPDAMTSSPEPCMVASANAYPGLGSKQNCGVSPVRSWFAIGGGSLLQIFLMPFEQLVQCLDR
jgi:hypothetical protein